jgi:predicted nucleic acid-binding Zn ribbon protein
MPVFDYKCDGCDSVYEDIDPAKEFPPVCCGVQTRKIWAMGGISFRGPGFYVNDYKEKRDESESSSENS